MTDFWKQKRAIEKQEQKARMDENLRAFSVLNLQPPIIVEHHFSEKTLYLRVPGFKTIRFFLHLNKWRHNDVTYSGNLVELCAWMYNRLDKKE